MSLTCQVRETFPVAVVSLTGDLTADSIKQGFEQALLEALAGMPVAMVIDGRDSTTASDAALDRLGELAEAAATWPGVPVVLCNLDFVSAPARRYLIHAPTLSAAHEALAGVVVPAREALDLPPDPASCARAREFVAAVCARWGLKRSARLAELVISELVANGVMHARTPLGVTVRRQDKGIEISVRDLNPSFTVPSAFDPRGFGLQLVASLSDSWGYAPTGSGKVVWTRLPGVDSRNGAPESGRLAS